MPMHQALSILTDLVGRIELAQAQAVIPRDSFEIPEKGHFNLDRLGVAQRLRDSVVVNFNH